MKLNQAIDEIKGWIDSEQNLNKGLAIFNKYSSNYQRKLFLAKNPSKRQQFLYLYLVELLNSFTKQFPTVNLPSDSKPEGVKDIKLLSDNLADNKKKDLVNEGILNQSKKSSGKSSKK